MRHFSKLIALLVVFLLAAMIASAQSSQSISYDEVVTGEIVGETYEQFYTFEGEEGDTILIRMSATSDNPRLDSYLYLRDAEGTELAFDDDTAGNLNSLIGPYTLPADGTYTIVATRYQQADGGSEGTYELRVSLAQTEPIELDVVEELELDVNNSIVILTFTAETSGIYQLNYNLVDGNGGTEISIRDQSGTYLTGVTVDQYNNGNFAVVRLEAGAVVSLFARYYESFDPQSGQSTPITVELTLALAEVETVELELNETSEFSGVLENVDSVAYYSFEAEGGQTIEIEGVAPDGGDFEVYVILPVGYTSYYGNSSYQQGGLLVPPQILSQSGDYILVVHRASIVEGDVADDEPVAYEVGLTVSSTPELIAGEAVEGSIDNSTQVYENAYIYNGSEGETITITLSSVDENYETSFSISLDPQDINDPSSGFYANFNSSLPGTFSYEVTLPRDGAYIIRVYDGGYGPNVGAGTYRLLIESN